MATPTAKSVSSAATRSVPECAASETSPRLPLASPAPSLSSTSPAAAATDTSAIRRCGVIAGRLRGRAGGLERPDDDVLALAEVEERLPVELDARWRHRVLADLRFGRLQRPGRMVDL